MKSEADSEDIVIPSIAEMIYRNRIINKIPSGKTKAGRTYIRQRGHNSMKHVESKFCFLYANFKCMSKLCCNFNESILYT